MMKSIIICEGETDLVLYSYYLSAVCGWQSLDKKENRSLKNAFNKRITDMKVEGNNQKFAWYYRNTDILCIYAVGSRNNISDGLNQIIALYSSSEENFDKVVVVSDRDNEGAEKEILKTISETFSKKGIVFAQMVHNHWNSSDTIEIMGEYHEILLLPLIIPFDESGTIETFLLNCRREISEDEDKLVDSAYSYIDELAEIEYVHNTYLPRRGLVPKSKLAAYFSVVSPDKVYAKEKKILEAIPWERYSTFHQTLHLLSEI
jgi:hypothetical protein